MSRRKGNPSKGFRARDALRRKKADARRQQSRSEGGHVGPVASKVTRKRKPPESPKETP